MIGRAGRTNLQKWMESRNLSWWVVTPALGFLLIAGLALALTFDESWDSLNDPSTWSLLFFPALVIYVLAVQPFLNNHFAAAAESLSARIALSDPELESLLERRTRLGGWLEIGCFLAGAVVGVLLERPWQDAPSLINYVYAPLASAILCGLIGWLVVTCLFRSQGLSYLHRGKVTLQPLDAAVRWSLEVSLILFGLLLFSWLFVLTEPAKLPFFIFGSISLFAVFLFLLNRVLSYLISSVYQSRILYAVILIFVTAAVGTLGYQVLEGWSLMDGLYMTVITMTTVGYSETRPLTEIGRVFTMVLVITSIGIAGYAISTVAGYVVEGEFNRLFRGRRMHKRIAKLNNHIILCGAGRVGREIAEEFYKTLTPFVIIEPKEEVLQQMPFLDEIAFLQADATRDQTLIEAGVEKAAGLVAALHEDQTNVFLVLSAKALNPRLRVIARLADDQNRKKIMRAGADEVVHPEAIGGLRMASMMIRPSVVTFLDQMLRVTGRTLRIEEVKIGEQLKGATLEQVDLAEQTGLLTVAIKVTGRPGYEFNPAPSTELNEGDVLIVMGTPQQLAKARQLKLEG